MKVFYLGNMDRLANLLAQRGIDLLLTDDRWTLVAQDIFDSKGTDQIKHEIGGAVSGDTRQVVEELPALESDKEESVPEPALRPAPLDDLLVE